MVASNMARAASNTTKEGNISSFTGLDSMFWRPQASEEKDDKLIELNGLIGGGGGGHGQSDMRADHSNCRSRSNTANGNGQSRLTKVRQGVHHCLIRTLWARH